MRLFCAGFFPIQSPRGLENEPSFLVSRAFTTSISRPFPLILCIFEPVLGLLFYTHTRHTRRRHLIRQHQSYFRHHSNFSEMHSDWDELKHRLIGGTFENGKIQWCSFKRQPTKVCFCYQKCVFSFLGSRWFLLQIATWKPGGANYKTSQGYALVKAWKCNQIDLWWWWSCGESISLLFSAFSSRFINYKCNCKAIWGGPGL